jgi:SpoVK/Ycf46/Vps4 family AAA+-type ATPase
MGRNEVDMDELLEQPLKWRQSGDIFGVHMDSPTIKLLPAGAYEPNLSITGPYVSKIDLKQEELIPFKNGPCSEITEEVEKFWSRKDRYDQIGLPYRRGILMYGPPGTGKSGIIRLVSQNIIERDGLVMIVKDASMFIDFLPVLNKLEPTRNLVVVLEDVEKLVNRNEHSFLQLLDGIAADRPGMLFLATTNHLERLEPRVYRPSRFDLLVEIGMPTAKVREVYVRRLCDKYRVKYDPKLVRLTGGLSFAALKEILVSCLVLDKKVEDMVTRMRSYNRMAEDLYDEDDD